MEEITVLFRVLRLLRLEVLELVVHVNVLVVVIFHLELTDVEERSHHGGVEGCATGNALRCIESALQLRLVKDLLADGLDNRGTCAVTNELHTIYLISCKTGSLNRLAEELGKLTHLRVNELLELFSLHLSVHVFVIEEVVNIDA